MVVRRCDGRVILGDGELFTDLARTRLASLHDIRCDDLLLTCVGVDRRTIARGYYSVQLIVSSYIQRDAESRGRKQEGCVIQDYVKCVLTEGAEKRSRSVQIHNMDDDQEPLISHERAHTACTSKSAWVFQFIAPARN